MTQQTYTIVGMTCDHCARSVTQEVGAVEGVTAVRVDLATGQVDLTATAPVPVAAVQAAIEEAGYTLAP